MLKEKNLNHIQKLLQDNPAFVFSKENLFDYDRESYSVKIITTTDIIGNIPLGFDVRIKQSETNSINVWKWEPVYIDKDMNLDSIDLSDTTIDNFFLESDNYTEGSLLCLKDIGNTVLDKI